MIPSLITISEARTSLFPLSPLPHSHTPLPLLASPLPPSLFLTQVISGSQALPLVGHVHLLTSMPHHALAPSPAYFSSWLGPILSLCLGRIPFVVVSSPRLAREVLKTHDAAFLFARYLSFNCSDVSSFPRLACEVLKTHNLNLTSFVDISPAAASPSSSLPTVSPLSASSTDRRPIASSRPPLHHVLRSIHLLNGLAV